MFSAIGSYLEEHLGKQGGAYKFTTIEYITNTDQYVTVRYLSETGGIELHADINFVHDGINIS